MNLTAALHLSVEHKTFIKQDFHQKLRGTFKKYAEKYRLNTFILSPRSTSSYHIIE